MNRRSMLKWLAGGVVTAGAGAALLPERTIFLPPRGGWIVMGRPFDEVIAHWPLSPWEPIKIQIASGKADAHSG